MIHGHSIPIHPPATAATTAGVRRLRYSNISRTTALNSAQGDCPVFVQPPNKSFPAELRGMDIAPHKRTAHIIGTIAIVGVIGAFGFIVVHSVPQLLGLAYQGSPQTSSVIVTMAIELSAKTIPSQYTGADLDSRPPSQPPHPPTSWKYLSKSTD